jgi:hypothetical protein
MSKNQNIPDTAALRKDLQSGNLGERLDAALALAKTGDFSGLPAIVDCLGNKNHEIRIKAAGVCEHIGFTSAVESLVQMATGDPVSDNRNQAIWALVGVGRPTVINGIIETLKDIKAERREDGRTALYRIFGKQILSQLADEDGGAAPDPQEYGRVTKWWEAHSKRFDPAMCYSFGELAGPGVFIRQLRTTQDDLPDAILDALTDWTGSDFGQLPLQKVVVKWEKWWSEEGARFGIGNRYFYGYPVP